MIFTLRSMKPTASYEADVIEAIPDTNLALTSIQMRDGEVVMTCTGAAYIVPLGNDIIQIKTTPR